MTLTKLKSKISSSMDVLTIDQKVDLALNSSQNEVMLMKLAAKSVNITTITNPAGYQECHAARMALRNQRVALEKVGKAARDEAQKFTKAVIAEEKRLIAIIEPEEKRLQVIQDAFDAIKEAEKAAALTQEKLRVENHQHLIMSIRNTPLEYVNKTADEVRAQIAALEKLDISKLEEYTDMAKEALRTATDKLNEMVKIALKRDEDAKKAEEQATEIAALKAQLEAAKAVPAPVVDEQILSASGHSIAGGRQHLRVFLERYADLAEFEFISKDIRFYLETV